MHQNNKDLENDHRSQLLHMETVNMMSKYQLVFVKLETSLVNWSRYSDQNVRMVKLRKAFEVMRERAITYR